MIIATQITARSRKISHWATIVGLVSLLPTIFLCSCSESGAKVWENHHKQGVAALEGKDFKLAQSEFEASLLQAREFAPDDIRSVISMNDLAAVYAQSDHSEKSKSLFERTMDLEAGHEEQSSAWRIETCRTVLGLANLYRDLGEFGTAKPLYEKAATVLKGTDNSTLQKLVAENAAKLRLLADETKRQFDARPTGPTYSNGKVKELMNAAFALPKTGSYQKGEAAWLATLAEAKRLYSEKDRRYREVLEAVWAFNVSKNHFVEAKKLVGDDIKNYPTVEFVKAGAADLTPENVEEALFLSKDLDLLATTLYTEGKTEESLPFRERAFAISLRCGAKNKEFAKLAEVLADTYAQLDQPEKACEEYRKAALAISAHAHIEPGVIAKILTKLAQVDKNIRHDYQAAEQDYSQLLAAVQGDPPAYLQTLVELAEMETKLHKYTEAQSYFEQASAFALSHKSLPDGCAWSAQVGLGKLFLEKKDWIQAAQTFHKSYEFAHSSKDKLRSIWMSSSLMSEAQSVASQRGSAEKLFQQAIACAKESHDCSLITTCFNAFADHFNSLADFPRAQAVQNQLSAYMQHDKTCSPHAQACLYWDMAGTQLCRGDLAQADALYDQAVRSEERGNPPDWQTLIRVLVNRGRVLAYERHPLQAQQYFLKAAQLCASKCSNNADLVCFLQLDWACCSWLDGKEDDFHSHLKIANDYVGKCADSPAKTVSELVNALNRYYVPGVAWDSPADLATATAGAEAMKKVLGGENLYYVCLLKQLEIQFAQAGRNQEAKYFRNRAESALRAVPR